MRRWIWRILLAALVLSALTVGAVAVETEGQEHEAYFTYKEYKENGSSQAISYEITGYTGPAILEKVRVPDVHEGKPVVSIADNAFSEATSAALREIILPNSLKNIGENAFTGAKNLTKIEVPGGVKIGNAAFSECYNLRDVVLLDYVEENGEISYINTEIGNAVFQDCENLTSVTLPGNLEKISEKAFSGCKELKSIVIPFSVREICNNAFSGCVSLTNIVFLRKAPVLRSGTIPWTNSGLTVHCPEGSQIYDTVLKNIGDVTRVHQFTDNSYSQKTSGLSTGSRCKSYGTDGKITVTFTCKGYTETIKETVEKDVPRPKTDEHGNPLKDPNGNIIYETDDKGNIICDKTLVEETVEKNVPCAYFSGGKYTQERKVSAPFHKLVIGEPSAPTCTKPGTKGGLVCDVCGEPFGDTELGDAALGHVFFDVALKPDGTEDGVYNAEGVYAPKEDPNGTKSEEKSETTKEPTCTEKGENTITKVCKRCGESIFVRTDDIPPTGHKYQVVGGKPGEKKPVRAATCEEFGISVAHMECTICHAKDSCTLCAAFEVAIKAGTTDKSQVTADGWTADFKPTPQTTPTPPVGTNSRTGGKALSMALYAEEDDTENPPAAGDDTEEQPQEITDAVIKAYKEHLDTYHKDGKPVGGQTFLKAEYDILDPIGHLPSEDTEPDEEKSKAPTCTEDGKNVYKGFYCVRPASDGGCGNPPTAPKWIDKEYEKVIPKLGHDMKDLDPVEEVRKEATCTEAGEKVITTVKECQRKDCSHIAIDGKPYRETTEVKETIPALGHKWINPQPVESEEYPRKEPTCGEDGQFFAIVECERCHEGSKKPIPIPIPATGDHDYGEWERTKEPTATQKGEQKRVCKKCGHEDIREIPALGLCDKHDFGDWVTVKEPTTTATGLKERTCKVCGYKESRTIPVLTDTKPPEPDTFTIEVIPPANGTLSASASTSVSGATITVRASASSGYELDAVRVTTLAGIPVTVTGTGSSRHFTMPASSVQVRADFIRIVDSAVDWNAPANTGAVSRWATPTLTTPQSVPRVTASSQTYRDIPAGHWAAGEIGWAGNMGYMSGDSRGNFNPDVTITFQQLWMVLARLNGSHPSSMADAQRWAVSAGFAEGHNPDVPVTRHELVTALYRCSRLMGSSNNNTMSLSGYTDSRTVPAPAKTAMAWAVANGIVGGTANGTLNPTGTTTRAQFAVILYRYSQRI